MDIIKLLFSIIFIIKYYIYIFAYKVNCKYCLNESLEYKGIVWIKVSSIKVLFKYENIAYVVIDIVDIMIYPET